MTRLVDKRAVRKGCYEARKQHDHDCYETATHAVRSLLQREPLYGTVLDPCCGSGVITKEIKRAFPSINVTACDIRNSTRVYDWTSVDFLIDDDLEDCFDFVVMNTPFRNSVPFVVRALKLARVAVYSFQRANWLATAARYRDLFRWCPPRRVWIFVNRVNCCPEGELDLTKGGPYDFAWFIFTPGHTGKAETDWIDDPVSMIHDTRIGIDEAMAQLKPAKRAKLLGVAG